MDETCLKYIITRDEFIVILSFLNARDVVQLSLVSKFFYKIVNSEPVWQDQVQNRIHTIYSSLGIQPNFFKKPENISWKNFYRKLQTLVLSCGYNRGPSSWGLECMPKEPDFGQLGYETREDFVNSFKVIPTLIGTNIKKVVCKGYHTLFLTDEGRVLSCGSNAYGQLGLGHRKSIAIPTFLNLNDVIDIQAGYAFSAVITKNGHLYTFGFNKNGRCGIPKSKSLLTEESNHPYIPLPTLWNPNIEVEQVACGSGHTLVLSKNGKVYAFGRNDVGQLGSFIEGVDTRYDQFVLNLPHRDNEYEAREVNGFESEVTQIYANAYRNAAITKNGKMYIWGNYGQIMYHPTAIGFSLTPTRIFCGDFDLLIQFGRTRGVLGLTFADILFENINIENAGVGGRHVIAVSEDGDLWVFGSSEFGQLGLEDDVLEPNGQVIKRSSLVGEKLSKYVKNIVSIGGGHEHSVLVLKLKNVFD